MLSSAVCRGGLWVLVMCWCALMWEGPEAQEFDSCFVGNTSIHMFMWQWHANNRPSCLTAATKCCWVLGTIDCHFNEKMLGKVWCGSKYQIMAPLKRLNKHFVKLNMIWKLLKWLNNLPYNSYYTVSKYLHTFIYSLLGKHLF